MKIKTKTKYESQKELIEKLIIASNVMKEFIVDKNNKIITKGNKNGAI